MEDSPRMRRFIVEFGMGLDQHGQDPTSAAVKAVKDAVSHACLAGLLDIVHLKDVNDMVVEIQLACPHPELLNREAVLAAMPFGKKSLNVCEGGMTAHGFYQPELGDKNDEAYIANAAVVVWVNVDEMLKSWA